MSEEFVGVSEGPVALETLQTLVRRCVGDGGWLCLRFPHRIDLLPMSELPESGLACMEGQAFNQAKELRWRKVGDRYEILLLSSQGGDDELTEMKRRDLTGKNTAINWETVTFDALAYAATETKLPRKINIPSTLNIGQRYFVDADTGCVQFIALFDDIKPSDAKESTQYG